MPPQPNRLPAGFPLSWPDGWARTPRHHRRSAPYRVTFGKARDDLARELKMFGAQSMVISTNLMLQLDGVGPKAGQPEPQDPGVALWWTVKEQVAPRVIACDKWSSVAENLRAVGLAIAAMRSMQRHGASQALDRAQSTFEVKALPSGNTGVKKDLPWWYYRLKLQNWPPRQEEIMEAFRTQAKVDHPDQGGNTQALLELTTARRDAEDWLKES